jgi:hypothetical protein
MKWKEILGTAMLLIAFNLTATAQNLIKQKTDTILLGMYPGILAAEYQIQPGNQLSLRKFDFQSELIKQIQANDILLKELRVSSAEHKTGGMQMEVVESKHLLDIKGFKTLKTIDIDYSLNGTYSYGTLHFKDQVPQGDWVFTERKAEAGKLGKVNLKTRMAFQDGIPRSIFQHEGSSAQYGEVKILGALTEDGFLTDTLFIEYTIDSLRIREERIYENGFLLEIRQFNNDNGVILEYVVFDDVSQKLEETNGEKGAYKISENGFGIKFNPGYPPSDIRIYSQAAGNQIFTDFLSFLSPYLGLAGSRDTIYFPLTRKFKYVYAEGEEEKIKGISDLCDSLSRQAEDFLSQPRYILRKAESDTLAFGYAWILHSKTKLDTIRKNVGLIRSDVFDYFYRNDYYFEGIAGLNKVDSFKYQYGAEKKSMAFQAGILVKNPATIIDDLNAYLDSLSSKMTFWTEVAKRKIVAYEKQESIDSLDLKIVQYATIVDSVFSKYASLASDNKTDNRPLSFKVIANAQKRFLNEKKSNYTSADSYEKTMARGERLLCTYKILSNHAFFDEISNMPRIWSDSLYTFYTDNPFDARPFENKILPAVLQAGIRLHQHYIIKLFQANNCVELEEATRNFEQLKAKMQHFSSNHTSEEVQFLNRVLRRETVATRIERILEL